MEMPTTAPVEMPVWNWMPSIALTTEMAGVSTPAEWSEWGAVIVLLDSDRCKASQPASGKEAGLLFCLGVHT